MGLPRQSLSDPDDPTDRVVDAGEKRKRRRTGAAPDGTFSHNLEAKMRIVFSLVIAGLLLGARDVRAGEDAAYATATVRRAIQVHGGEANLDKLMTCIVEAEGWVNIRHPVVNIAEYTYTARVTAKPGKFTAYMKYYQTICGGTKPYMTTRMVYNGGAQIVTDGKNQLLKDEVIKELRTVAYQREVGLLTPLLRDKKFKLTVINHETKLAGKTTVAVGVHHQDHPDIILYFDKANGTLFASKRDFYQFASGKVGELLNYYSDFRPVSGALIPHRTVSYQDGLEASVERITSVRLLESAPDEWFRIVE
jgi:hypothetical protein